MTATWEPSASGVLRLPSGRLVRGRGLSRPLPAGPQPAFALYLLDDPPDPAAWEHRWLHWPDFGLPSDPACLAVLDGLPGPAAVGYVRQHYSAHAVETPAQRAFVARFPGSSVP